MILFLEKIGLLLFFIGTIGWFTDFSVLNLRWLYLLLLAIGTLLYLMPEEYYTLKGKKERKENEKIL